MLNLTPQPMMEPFRFAPTGGEVVGSAFSTTFRVFATVIVGGCTIWFAQLWSRGALGSGVSNGTGWFIAGLALMAWTWWSIMISRTRIHASGLHQRWVWDKAMAFDDLAYVRVIRVPGLSWLIAPRLYVRTLAGKFTVFYGATPGLIAEFERIGAELKAFRQF
ncbi:MAG: hypothetical protein QE485_05705 [Acidovorax sp.]|jgi:hypothetical protein|uniref:hypothetical protein n=1 Tax=Acidovorax sp. TaxID=1872122 RepID=UPI0026107C8E|nr:hypothetical protein [Acidovorax sp.]MDH4416701.1 hypothetical protein [Acidovorax sp.]